MNLFIPLFINSYLLNNFFFSPVYLFTQLAFPQSCCYPSLYALLKLLSYISCSFAFSILVFNGPTQDDHTGLKHPGLFELQNNFISNQ